MQTNETSHCPATCPTAQGQKASGTRQLLPGMRASTSPQAGRGPGPAPSRDPSATPATQIPNNRNWSPLSPRRVPDSNKNSSLKINESKGHQRATLMSRGNPVCGPVGEALLCLRTKAPSVTSSSRFKSTRLLALAPFQNHKYIQGQPRQQQSQEIQSPNEETDSPFQACLLPGSWRRRLHSPPGGRRRPWIPTAWTEASHARR